MYNGITVNSYKVYLFGWRKLIRGKLRFGRTCFLNTNIRRGFSKVNGLVWNRLTFFYFMDSCWIFNIWNGTADPLFRENVITVRPVCKAILFFSIWLFAYSINIKGPVDRNITTRSINNNSNFPYFYSFYTDSCRHF